VLAAHERERKIGSDVPVEPEDLFEMANLQHDGLPMTVGVIPLGNAQDDVRVKVNITNGDQIDIANMAVLVRPTPCVIAGQLCPAGAQAVIRWISLNTERWLRIGRGRSTQGSFVRC
jgi:hypothetical protein